MGRREKGRVGCLISARRQDIGGKGGAIGAAGEELWASAEGMP
jgi:hypothetical protein